jgi:hypothetical protein
VVDHASDINRDGIEGLDGVTLTSCRIQRRLPSRRFAWWRIGVLRSADEQVGEPGARLGGAFGPLERWRMGITRRVAARRWLGGLDLDWLRDVEVAAMTRHDAVELGQRLDLVDEHAAHLGRAFGGITAIFRTRARPVRRRCETG